jgi:hypothetical protein
MHLRTNSIGCHFVILAVEIKPAGGSRGALYHRIEFSNAPSVAVVTVLSEGESVKDIVIGRISN